MLIFSFLLLLCICFPYVTPISFGTDVQPWGVMFATILTAVLLLKGYKFKITFTLLFIPIIASILLFLFSDTDFDEFRSFTGYVSIGVIPLAFHYLLKTNYENTIAILKFAIIIYLVVALVQTFIYIDFMSFVLNRLSGAGSGGRGVNSLSTEPTFYGLICLFLLLIISELEMTNKKFYIFLLLFQIIFLSQSSLTILLLLIFGFFYVLFKLSPMTIFLASITYILLFYVVTISDIQTRSIVIATKFITNPEVLLIDASINSRAAHIYFSIKGFFDNYGVPAGFSAFPAYWTSEIVGHDIFIQYTSYAPNRIMSYYGAILFELGLIGALIPITYSIILFQAYRYNIRQFLILIFSINIILFTAVPVTFTLVGMYFGALIYKAENRIKPDNYDIN